jgi:hypothetical protein
MLNIRKLTLLPLTLLLAWAFALSGSPEAGAATCTAGSIDGSFASPATNGSISSGGEIDCYSLPTLASGDRVAVHFETSGVSNGSPIWRLRDGNGNEICGAYYYTSTCPISGVSGWSLEIADASASSGTFSYSISLHRLNDPQGCADLGAPSSWSFGAGRIDGTLLPGGARCYTFERQFGEADGSYWFRSIRTGGNVNPHWQVYGASGSEECAGWYGGLENRCRLISYGQFAFVVDAPYSGEAGSFLATARKLNAPQGCGASPPMTIGAEPVSGSIATAGETDCFALTGLTASDAVSLALSAGSGSNQSPRWSLIDGEGSQICDSNSGYDAFTSCDLSGTAGWALVVYDNGGGTFTYSLSVRRLTDPSGCAQLGEPSVWSFASGRLNGSVAETLQARCYTFERGIDEGDGSYWFRTARSAGTLAPYWSVYGPSGSQECEGGNSTIDQSCRLLADGQYIFLVADNSGEKTGSFYATTRRLTDRLGCSTLASTAFGADAVAGDLSTGGSIDCHAIPGVSAGDSVAVDFRSSSGSSPSPRWTIIDGNGNTVCDSYSYGYSFYCLLSGTPGWSLLAYDAGAGSFSYSLAVRRLTNPQGCTPLANAALWSFTGPRLDGSIDGTLDSRCYTFTRAPSDPDGAHWFRTIRTSGAVNPKWSLYGPNGQRECNGSNDAPGGSCRLLAGGQFALVVADSGGDQTGNFLLTAKKLNPPSGCSEISTVAFGISSTAGTLSSAGEADCYRFDGSSGDILKLSSTGAATAFALLNPEGEPRCFYFNSQCVLNEDAKMTLLVYSYAGTGTGSYHFEAACENVPCGQSETAVADVAPNRVGAGEFTSVVVRGRDLDLLESVKLLRNGQQVDGQLAEPAADGRAVEARFDLSEASLGSWELQAKFIDGTTRNLAGAVTVESQRPARISVELIGREAFRVNRPSTVTVSVHNSGNVDGMIVPIALSGIPEGSIVEPLFEMQAPNGSLSEPELVDGTYSQATDTVTFDDGIALPMYLPRVPAGRTMQFQYRITAPVQGVSFKLRAAAGQCLGNRQGSFGATTSLVSTRALNIGSSCVMDVAGKILSLAVPFSSCFSTGYELATSFGRAVFSPFVDGLDPVGMSDAASIGLNAVGCGVEASGVGLVTKKVVQGAGLVGDATQLVGDCWVPQSESELPQTAVTAIDPNELVGPIGVGPQRYLSGDAPFEYRILFENVATATAPAQRVKVLNQLDATKLNPASVLFQDVRFGSTVFALPYASHEIHDRIDLRPDRDLLVDVDATVSPSGLVEVELQAIDPETLGPPEDPLAGFLPPNMTSPEGEGQVSYTVSPKSLPSGSVVSNQASIVFDDNDPIETPAWTNTIDRQPPVPTVSAQPGSAPGTAEVSWSGSDDAAGISLYEIEVSKNGGPFALWKTSTVAASSPYLASEAGAYSFRVVARDGADNTGQSALAGATLDPQPEPEEQEEEPSPGAPSPSPPPPAPQAPAAATPPNPRAACVQAATAAYKRASKAAKKKHGKARAKAMKAARNAKKKRLQAC